MSPLDPAAVRRAAEAIAAADAILVGAGAGMGVDSGLPDFRGDQGFWKAYPAYARLGLRFAELANPRWFEQDPRLAWGFYGHRLNLYRKTRPHDGFALLLRWAEPKPHGAFAFTSNVDGQFQRAGFSHERVIEIHGALERLQCSCGVLFGAPAGDIELDEETLRATGELPDCPKCSGLGRPNILMFGDADWIDTVTAQQERRLVAWLGRVSRLVVVECGAGTAIPSVRHFSEGLVRRAGATLVRINPRDPEVPSGQISLPAGALEGLKAIDAALPAG